MIFEKAKVEDSGELLALYRTSLEDKFSVWDEEYPGPENIREDLELGNLFILRDGKRIAGAISLCPHDEEADALPFWQDRSDGHVEFARVCVHPAYHGRGLALELVKNIEDEARRRGHSSVRLLVAKSNVPAYKTYLKAGYKMLNETEIEIYGNLYTCGEKIF